MSLAIPIAVLYAGLAGCLLALIVAAATNRWSLRVFFLLALRLAIGWHFLFEGLHKINSEYVGKTETNRPFTSAPYFQVAEGPFGEYMRQHYLGNPQAEIAAKLTPKENITAADFAKLPADKQAALCPDAAAAELSKAIPDAAQAQEAKAAFARWVYGVDRRDAKVLFVNNADVPQSAPDRLGQIDVIRHHVEELQARDAAGLGKGYDIELKRAAAARADLRAAVSNLALDADKFLDELITDHGGKVEAEKPKPIKRMDTLTMWVITLVGVCLLAGLFTPLACVVGAGFLLLTYLTHPPFPWYPLPPNTEGHPLFVNKNLIEMLALFVIAVHPTGRWMGVDALLCRLCCRRRRVVVERPGVPATV